MPYNHTSSSATDTALAVKTILVVEDDEDLGDLITQVIQQGNTREKRFEAILAPDSLQALTIVKDIKPDLFLLDYYLPRMNGLQLYDHLHVTEGLEHVPAIMLSVDPPRKELEKRHLIGLKKPFNLKDLYHTIETILG